MVLNPNNFEPESLRVRNHFEPKYLKFGIIPKTTAKNDGFGISSPQIRKKTAKDDGKWHKFATDSDISSTTNLYISVIRRFDI